MNKMMMAVSAMAVLGWSVAAQAVEVEIPSGTVVVVQTTQQLNGNNLASGQNVNSIIVMQDVKVNGHTVIKGGTPVYAVVADAEESGYVGQAGKLVISIQATNAVDGTNVPLSGTMMVKEDSEVGATAAASIILCPLFALNKGDEAVIPSGHQVRAMTMGSVRVKVR